MRKLLLLLFLVLPVFAQTSITHGAGAPSASTCSTPAQVGRTYANTTPNPAVLYLCGTTGWGISGGSGGGATIPNTTNIINGSGTGNGADSGLTVASVVTLTGTQTLTNKTVDGVSPATFAFVDPSSSIQTQLNGKAASNASTTVNSQSCALGSTCTIPLVASFNTRTGAVTLSSGDVTTALGYTPLSTTTLVTGAQGGTGVNNGASTITIGGNVTYTGAFTFAGTVTGNTAVTFPTSGTLLGTAAAVTVGQGGTGLAAGTSGGIPYYSSTSAMTSSAALASASVVFGGGAGGAPVTTSNSVNCVTSAGNHLTCTGASIDAAFFDDGGKVGPYINASSTIMSITGRTANVTGVTVTNAGIVGIGPANTAPSGVTIDISDKTASTGATRVNIGRGAADGANTVIVTNNGSENVSGFVRTVPTVVGSLAACGASFGGARDAVTDATTPAIGSPVVGSGAVFAMVHCSLTGNAWIVDGL